MSFKEASSIIEHLEHNELFLDRNEVENALAQQVSWKSMPNSGSANFVSHRLEVLGEGRLKFQPTTGMGCFINLFIVLGVLIFLFAITLIWAFGWGYMEDLWVVPTVGIFFVVFAVVFRKFGMNEIYFDKTKGYCWRGKKDFNTLEASSDGKQVRLSEIVALQLLRKRVLSSKRNYDNLELNLILQNGKRFHLISHIGVKELLIDTGTLAAVLKVPTWVDVS